MCAPMTMSTSDNEAVYTIGVRARESGERLQSQGWIMLLGIGVPKAKKKSARGMGCLVMFLSVPVKWPIISCFAPHLYVRGRGKICFVKL